MNLRHLAVVSVCFTAMLGAATAACDRKPDPSSTGTAAAPAASYTVNGVVKSIDTAKKTVLIAHEDVPGYMKAMTMPFDLKDEGAVRGIAVGDKVSFTFTDEGRGRLVVQSIRKAP